MDKADIDETIARNGTRAAAKGSTDRVSADATPTTVDATEVDATEVELAAGVSGAPDVTSGFLSELTEAMMAVVGKERDRVTAIVEADAAAHLVDAKERATTEAEAFRQIADEDVASIEGWADAEVERIRADAARRIGERGADLDTSLAQQEAVLDAELKSIDAAVAAYAVTLQSYLDDLRETGDPSEIAGRAHELPNPPSLDDVRAIARAEALTQIAEAAAPAAEVPATDVPVDDMLDVGVDPGAPLGTAEAASDAVTDDTDAVPVVAAAEDGAAEDGSAGPEPEPWPTTGAETPAGDADVAGIPVAVDGGSGRTGWETDGGLEALMDPPANAVDTSSTASTTSGDRPVAVMDPAATAGTGWETELATPMATAVATAEATDVGHPNAAVRLIRSVAPWTAPTQHSDRTDTGTR